MPCVARRPPTIDAWQRARLPCAAVAHKEQIMNAAMTRRSLAIATVGLALAAAPAAAYAPHPDIEVQDSCDPVTFDAALGAGACARPAQEGGRRVTVDEFVSRLQSRHEIDAWSFTPSGSGSGVPRR
jgi:hypothetical protein